jgi:hypothetical protein
LVITHPLGAVAVIVKTVTCVVVVVFVKVIAGMFVPLPEEIPVILAVLSLDQLNVVPATELDIVIAVVELLLHRGGCTAGATVTFEAFIITSTFWVLVQPLEVNV